MMTCKEITTRIKSKGISRSKIVYEDIFKDHMKQKGATALFKELLEIRKQLEADNQLNLLGPCTSTEMQLNSSDLLVRIDDYSSWTKAGNLMVCDLIAQLSLSVVLADLTETRS